MKNNYVSIKDVNGKSKNYRIILNIECEDNHPSYVLYTDESKNKSGEVKVYASTYILSKSGNMTKFSPVKEKSEFDFIEKILNSLEE